VCQSESTASLTDHSTLLSHPPHLNRIAQLVTATAAVQLHSDASIYVWAAEDGQLLRTLSST